MSVVVLLVGIFILGTCLAFFVSPALVDELIVWLGTRRNLLYVAALRLVLGTLLLLGAPQTDYPLAIRALGVLLIVAGIVLLASPPDLIKRITVFCLNRPVWVVRTLVSLPMALGLFIIYAVL